MDQTKGLSEEDRTILQNVLNADPAAIEEATLAAQNVLQKVLSSKSVEDSEIQENPESQETYDEVREKLYKDFGMEELSKAFEQIGNNIQLLNEKIAALEAVTKQTEDDLVAKAFDAPDWKIFKSEEDVDIEALKENALGEKPVAGIKVAEDTENPMYLGWIKPMGIGQ